MLLLTQYFINNNNTYIVPFLNYLYICMYLCATGSFYIKYKIIDEKTEATMKECFENSSNIYGDDGMYVCSILFYILVLLWLILY
jgi:hypothetical protein